MSTPAVSDAAVDAAARAVSEQDLLSIVGQVWESLLGADAEPGAVAQLGTVESGTLEIGTLEIGTLEIGTVEPGAHGEQLSAQVRLTGAWTGAVTVVAARAAAARMASTMLALPAGQEPEQVDVEDAFGEVVNVLGGSIKALLPAPSTLSLPSVVTGPPSEQGRTVREVVADWAGAGVRVSLRAHDPAPAPTGAPVPAPEAAQEQQP